MTAKPRVALFIDAENASPEHIDQYLKRCRELGKPTIGRCYGSPESLKKWDAQIGKHYLIPVQTPPSASKSNASDFALTIDAVSLLHRGLFDHAVIASSDADFTLLAIHIREYGKGIDGIGEAEAKVSLKSSFDNFTMVSKTGAAKLPAKASAKAPAPKAESKATGPSGTVDGAWLLAVFDKIKTANDDCDVQALGRALAKERADYKKGHRTLDNVLKKSGLFSIEGGRAILVKR